MTTIPFETLQQQANDYAADCSDAYAATSKINFAPDYGLEFEAGANLFAARAKVAGRMNDYAARQVASRLDAPNADWLFHDDHCPDAFRVEILNRLLGLRDEATYLIRSKGTMIRGILSDQYTPFDNVRLIDLVGDALATMGTEVKVARAEVGDELGAYILLPQISFGKDPRGTQTNSNGPNGDGGLHPAVYLSNSEVGRRSVRIAGGTFTGICSNGVIYGLRKGENVFSVRHRFISKTTMGVLVAEAIVDAFHVSEEGAKRFVEAQEVHVEPVSLAPLVDQWARTYGLSIDARTSWLTNITIQAAENGRTQDPRLFDVVNAATLVARDMGLDSREPMEEMAGALLFSPLRAPAAQIEE